MRKKEFEEITDIERYDSLKSSEMDLVYGFSNNLQRMCI